MTRIFVPALAGATLLLLSGCAASTAFSVISAPVKVAGKAVDLATTSQSESDRNYGKRMREAEEREGRERRQHDEACRRDSRKCGPYTGFRASGRRDD